MKGFRRSKAELALLAKAARHEPMLRQIYSVCMTLFDPPLDQVGYEESFQEAVNGVQVLGAGGDLYIRDGDYNIVVRTDFRTGDIVVQEKGLPHLIWHYGSTVVSEWSEVYRSKNKCASLRFIDTIKKLAAIAPLKPKRRKKKHEPRSRNTKSGRVKSGVRRRTNLRGMRSRASNRKPSSAARRPVQPRKPAKGRRGSR